MSRILAVASMVLFGLTAPVAAAEPSPWGLGLQPAASSVMERMTDFHNFLLIIITCISLFVLALLLFVIFRFNEKRNPTPSRTTHNALIEVVWTVVPAIILVVIAVPSFKLLYYADRTADAEMTVKAVGFQWAWRYEYPDEDGLTFDSYMIPTDELQAGQRRLLDVDNPLVLPTDTNIRVLVTADDVLHSFALPAMGVKMDAVPGRLNETWFRIPAGKEGMYYGQCSELCGVAHAFMPISLRAVSKADYAEWVEQAKAEFAELEGPPPAPRLSGTDDAAGAQPVTTAAAAGR